MSILLTQYEFEAYPFFVTRSSTTRLENKLASKDGEIEMILKKAVSEGDANGNKTALLHGKMLVCSLKRKCKQLKQEEVKKQAELDEIKSQLKFSQLHEIQVGFRSKVSSLRPNAKSLCRRLVKTDCRRRILSRDFEAAEVQ